MIHTAWWEIVLLRPSIYHIKCCSSSYITSSPMQWLLKFAELDPTVSYVSMSVQIKNCFCLIGWIMCRRFDSERCSVTGIKTIEIDWKSSSNNMLVERMAESSNKSESNSCRKSHLRRLALCGKPICTINSLPSDYFQKIRFYSVKDEMERVIQGLFDWAIKSHKQSTISSWCSFVNSDGKICILDVIDKLTSPFQTGIHFFLSFKIKVVRQSLSQWMAWRFHHWQYESHWYTRFVHFWQLIYSWDYSSTWFQTFKHACGY